MRVGNNSAEEIDAFWKGCIATLLADAMNPDTDMADIQAASKEHIIDSVRTDSLSGQVYFCIEVAQVRNWSNNSISEAVTAFWIKSVSALF